MKPTTPLKADRLRHRESSGDLKKPGDFVITRAGIAGTIDIINAVVMKCPYCGMDMMTTAIHTIYIDAQWRRILRFLGFKYGVSVRPHIQCPYSKEHAFVVEHGMIYPFQKDE